jgi:tRNA(adenine34) deaminase
MLAALAQARLAETKGEVPIGAVLVANGRVVARSHNRTRLDRDPTAHAEIVLIRKAIRKIRNERFLNTALYVTLEPCAMCAGAIVQARIPLVVYGAEDPKAGACGSVFTVLPSPRLNHRPEVVPGVEALESARLLSAFFKRRRAEKRAERAGRAGFRLQGPGK